MLKRKNRACGAPAVCLCAGVLLWTAGCSGGGDRAGAMGLWSQEAAGQPERFKGGSVPIRVAHAPAQVDAGSTVHIRVKLDGTNEFRTAYRVVLLDPSGVVECAPDTVLVAKAVDEFDVIFKLRENAPPNSQVHFDVGTMDGRKNGDTDWTITVREAPGNATTAAAAAVVASAAPMQPEVSGMKGGSVPISNCPEKDEVVIHAAAGETLLLRVNLQGNTLAGQEFTIEADPPGAGKLFNMPEKIVGVVGDTWIEVPLRVDPSATGDAVLKVTGRGKTVKYILKLK